MEAILRLPRLPYNELSSPLLTCQIRKDQHARSPSHSRRIRSELEGILLFSSLAFKPFPSLIPPHSQPLLLLSHYDVTPVAEATVDLWKYDPFGGEVHDGFIWGRGSADDKTLLVAQYEGITALLETGWRPRRTIILSHGFDEG